MESRKDALRVLSIFAAVVSASSLAIYGLNILSGSSASATGAVSAVGSSGGFPIAVPILSFLLLIASIVFITRLNRYG